MSAKRKPAPKTRGELNVEWIEDFCHYPEGKFVGRPVRLDEWQKVEICRIYDNPHGTRRAILSFGRKNGKTALSAFLLLLHLCGLEHRPNSQLYSAAQSLEQAAVVFGLAAKCVRLSPDLAPIVVVRDTAKELLCPTLGTKYRALSAEAPSAFGLSPVFIVHDELGQVKGPRSLLYEALETATGAQENPLSLIISTQAPTDADLLSVLIDDAKSEFDPRVVLALYTAPLDDDPYSDETIRKANPAFDSFMNATEVRAMAADAKRMSSREAEYRNLILNQRVEANSPFVARSVWAACGAPVKPIDGAVQVWGGLDLSTVNDLSALVLVGWVDGAWQVHPTFWLPQYGIREKAQRDRVQWDVWADKGYLNLTPGKSVDYDYIAQFLFDLFHTHNVVKIGFDRWYFSQLRPCLARVGFHDLVIDEKFAEFGQGYASMSPALRRLEGEILNQRLAHGNHPVLTSCAANAVVDMDPAGNRKLTKSKSTGRIDGLVALAMAMGAAPGEDPDLLNRTILERGGLP